jgi:ribosome-associated protein
MSERTLKLQINDTLSIPIAEFQFAYVRSSGPGGQNVNKVNSQVQLAWDVEASSALPEDVRQRLVQTQRGRISKAGLLRIDCEEFRTRERNRDACLERLRDIIRQAAIPPKKRRKTRVPKRVIEGRLRDKQERSEVKQARRRPRLDD